MSARTRRIVLTLVALAAAVLVAIAAAVVLVPSVRRDARSVLGLHAALQPCVPSDRTVVLPDEEATPARWEHVRSFPFARDELRAAALGDTVYVGSGVEPGRTELGLSSTDDLFAFDARSGRYSRAPDLPIPTDHPAVVSHRGDVYVIGGWVDSKPVADAWRYSPRTRRWSRLPPLSTARGGAGAAVVDGAIVVVGGSGARHVGANPEAVATVEVLEPGARAWRRLADLPTPRHHHGVAALGRSVYAVGGRGATDLSLATVEQLDLGTGGWTTLAPLPLGAGGVALVAADDRTLVAVGGGDDAEGWVTPATWAYGADDDRWRRLPDLNVARHGHAAAFADGSVFVFGGSPCPGYGAGDTVERLTVVATD